MAGIEIGDWLYSIDGSKYKTTANKVVDRRTYLSYKDLVKEHSEFKSTKVKFNRLIKERA